MKFRKLETTEPAEIKTALVLSGGGAKGAYQVGVIKELLTRGIKFDLVTGSSIGAFNGALLAECIKKGLNYKETGDLMEKVWTEVNDFLSFNWSSLFKKIYNPLTIPSIFTNRVVKAILKEYIAKNRSFSEYTDCQLSVTATDLNRKMLEVFDFNADIPVIKAVLASMAYPVAFPAVKIENRDYIDGGILNNTPLKEAILWGAKRIIVVFLTPLSVIEGAEKTGDVDYRKDQELSIIEVLDNFIDLASINLMYGDLKKARRINKLIRLLNNYEEKLPAGFIGELRKLFNIKPAGEKRVVHITRIAPDSVLKPPGTMGFNKRKVLSRLIARGKKDASKL